MERTIAAIATPYGTGGVSIIRISGSNAFEIAARIFSAPDKIKDAESHTMHHGFICDDGIRIDEVLISIMKAPHTYTGENVAEINCHGGITVTNKVLELCLKAGAYPAEPGEFTKRAFLNGKMDLSRAEAVIDLINAKNELSRKNAFSQLEGSLGKRIIEVRSGLIELAAKMQVAIDYPDEDLEDVTREDITDTLKMSLEALDKLLRESENGRIVSDGIKTAIVGKPNVGKSSLLNRFSGTERAIVTDIAGTTRDIVTDNVNFYGIPLALFDTAGIHDTDDPVEKIGVSRSKDVIENSDLVIVMLDAVTGIDSADRAVLDQTYGKQRIIAVNKTDKADIKGITSELSDMAVIPISAKTGEGIKEIADEIRHIFNIGAIMSEDNTIITNMRHKTAVRNAADALLRAVEAIECGIPQDLITIDMNTAMDCLGEITGACVSDDVVSEIFHRFCVGK